MNRLSIVTLRHRLFHKLKKEAFSLLFFPDDDIVTAAAFKIPVSFPYSMDAATGVISRPTLTAVIEDLSQSNNLSSGPSGALLSGDNLQYEVSLPAQIEHYFDRYGLAEMVIVTGTTGSETHLEMEFPLSLSADRNAFSYAMSGKFFVTLYPFTFRWLEGGQRNQRKAVLLIGIQDNDRQMMTLAEAGNEVTIAKQYIPEYKADKLYFDLYEWLNELRRRSTWEPKDFERTYGSPPELPLIGDFRLPPPPRPSGFNRQDL